MEGRTRVFIDFWNFQLNWNERIQAKCDWRTLPTVLVHEADRVLSQVDNRGDMTRLSLTETRLYASVDPHNEKEGPLKGWLDNTVRRMASYHMEIRERRRQPASLFCRHCHQETATCPTCAEPFVRSVEKGVDSAIVTDMLCSDGRAAWTSSSLYRATPIWYLQSERCAITVFVRLTLHGVATATSWPRGAGDRLISTLSRGRSSATLPS